MARMLARPSRLAGGRASAGLFVLWSRLLWCWLLSVLQLVAFAPYVFLLGGMASSGFVARAMRAGRWFLEVERWCGLSWESVWSVWLHSSAPWLWVCACWLYVVWHLVALCVFLPIVVFSRPTWSVRVWLSCFLAVLVWCLVSWLFPVSPPRLLSIAGVPDGFGGLAARLAFYQYAAFPSFHVAFAELVAVFWRRLWPSVWASVLSWLYVALMAVLVVATGNHYVLDIFGGVVLARGSVWASDKLWRRLTDGRPARALGPV